MASELPSYRHCTAAAVAVHIKEPTVFVQLVVFEWQAWLPNRHSSMSATCKSIYESYIMYEW